MKYLFLFFGLLFSFISYSQVDVVCLGSETESYSITPNAGSTYSWQVVGGGVIVGASSGTSIIVDWSAAPIGLITDAITLTETSSSNCSADVTLDVDIVDNPIQNLAVNNSEICIGDQIELTATDYANTTYEWTPFNASNSIESYLPVSLTDNTFTVTATNSDGCTSTASVTIVINDLPVVNAIVNDSEICLGESIDLNATPGLASYVWTPAVVSDDGGTFVPTIDQTNFNVVVTDNNGCIASDDVSIVVNDIPTLDLTVDGLQTTTICLGDQIDLQATPGLTYVWTPAVVSNEGGFYTPTSLTETSYAVTATDANGCENNDNLNITINNIPTPGPIIFN
ncbi:MAG: hypothetical protein ACON4Y_05065 [Flavobacteriales bacterium]